MASSYSLGEHYEQFVKGLVDSGRYASASEVMRDGLRLVEEREQLRVAKLEALRTEVAAGIASGPAESHDMAAVKVEARARRNSGGKAQARG